MFTSRAEFRLHLRADTAEQRLCPIADKIGILDDARRKKHLEWNRQRQKLFTILKTNRLEGLSAEEWLRRPEKTLSQLQASLPAGTFDEFDLRIRRQVEADVKYAGYYRREQKAADKLRKLEAVKMRSDFDYCTVPGIKFESQEKLNAVKPATLGQASRISGITPADIMVILVFLGKA
jgi:tRNA uridine 5-carboxymethylaminomethyl modification enzyme